MGKQPKEWSRGVKLTFLAGIFAILASIIGAIIPMMKSDSNAYDLSGRTYRSTQELATVLNDRWKKLDQILGEFSSSGFLDSSEQKEVEDLRAEIGQKHKSHFDALTSGDAVLAHERQKELDLTLKRADGVIGDLRKKHPEILTDFNDDDRKYIDTGISTKMGFQEKQDSKWDKLKGLFGFN
jgi:hypothetical protein